MYYMSLIDTLMIHLVLKIYSNSTIIQYSSTIYTVLWYDIAEVVVKLFVKCLHSLQWKSATYWINHNVCLATFSIAWTHLFLATPPHYHSFSYSLPHANALLVPLDYDWPSYEPAPSIPLAGNCPFCIIEW